MKQTAKPRITLQWVWVTPELAKKMLLKQVPNRKLSATRAEAYAHVMRAGQWKETPEPLMLTRDRKLVDGQHRLHGIVRSGVPQWMLVAMGVHEHVFDVINCGGPRTVADVLSIAGARNTTSMAASMRLRKVYLAYGGLPYVERYAFALPDKRLTNSQGLKVYQANPERWDHAAAQACKARPVGNPAICGFIAFEAAKQGQEKQAEKFFRGLKTGENLKKGSPVLALKNQITKEQVSRKSIPNMATLARWHLWAWCAFLAGKSVQRIANPREPLHFPHTVEP